MNILVTGGAGFIGSHTCDMLANAGHTVRILDCLDPQIHGPHGAFPAGLAPGIERMRGDVCSMDDCLAAVEGIDAVLHLASRTGVGQSMTDVADYVETNVRGTATLIEAVTKSRARLRRFVLASSRAVYGEGLFECARHGRMHPDVRDRARLLAGRFDMPCPVCDRAMQPVPTPESCDSKPLSAYAWTKRHQEDLCQWAVSTFDIPTVILRYFNVYGSGQSLQNPYTGVVSIFYSRLKAGRSLSLYERGLPLRDFVHVQDVARANLLALEGKDAAGGCFNIGSGQPRTIADIAQALGRQIGMETVPFEDRGEFRVGDVFACVADLERAAAQLGYRPTVDLDEGMREFAAWAAGQDATDGYDKTVAELSQYGLFGAAGPKKANQAA